MTVTDRAVRKANGKRLLREFAAAARIVNACARSKAKHYVLRLAQAETSRTRYACLMTAFGF